MHRHTYTVTCITEGFGSVLWLWVWLYRWHHLYLCFCNLLFSTQSSVLETRPHWGSSLSVSIYSPCRICGVNRPQCSPPSSCAWMFSLFLTGILFLDVHDRLLCVRQGQRGWGWGAVAFVQVEDEDKGLRCRWIQGTFRDHGCGRRGLFGLEARGWIPPPTFWLCDLGHVTLLLRASVSSPIIWIFRSVWQGGCEGWVSETFSELSRV